MLALWWLALLNLYCEVVMPECNCKSQDRHLCANCGLPFKVVPIISKNQAEFILNMIDQPEIVDDDFVNNLIGSLHLIALS